MKTILFAALGCVSALFFSTGEGHAAVLIAYDDASQAAYQNNDFNSGNDFNPANNTNGWWGGDNGGYGYQIWSLFASSPNPNDAGLFLGSSTGNGDGTDNGTNGGVANDGDIDTAGRAWGMYGNGGFSGNAVRMFNSLLQVGQTFSIDMDNGFVNNGGEIGLNLVNPSGNGRGTLYFSGGGTDYSFFGDVNTSLGVAYGDEGLRIDMTLTGIGETLDITLTRRDGTTATTANVPLFSAGGTRTGTGVQGVFLYNQSAGSGSSHDLFVNSMQITSPLAAVPEPGTIVVWGVVLAAVGLVTSCRRSK